MTIDDLILHYRSVKSVHAPLSPSLLEKVGGLSRALGHLPANSDGLALSQAARNAWPHAAPGTIKRHLVQLRAILRRCADDGIIARCPHIETPYVNDVVYVNVTAAEVSMLLDYIQAVDRRWYPLTLLLAHTGARLGEALLVQPERDLRNGTITIHKPVNRRSKTIRRVLPCTSRMNEAIKRGFFDAPLLPSGVSQESASVCLGRVLSAACTALGLPRLRVHDLRHAYAAILAERGADIADISSALGHSSLSVSMRYRGLVATRLTQIVARV